MLLFKAETSSLSSRKGAHEPLIVSTLTMSIGSETQEILEIKSLMTSTQVTPFQVSESHLSHRVAILPCVRTELLLDHHHSYN